MTYGFMALSELAILAVSVIILARAASTVVDNAVKISKFFRISKLAVGVVLLAVATSLPELSVSVVSSVSNEGAIAAGNVFGSNIANILLILGAGAFLYNLKISPANLRDIGIVLLTTTLISVYILFNSTIQQSVLGLPEGMILLGAFTVFAWHMIQKKKVEDANHEREVTKAEALRAFLLFCVGIIFVILSSGFVVDSAVKLAQRMGIAESFIGATIIAMGTSLPELTIDLQAIRKKHYGLALGDAIGSNMANLTLVLGTAAVINQIHVNIAIFVAALLFAVIANSILFYVAAVNKKLGRNGGVLFLALYMLYMIVIFSLQFKELGGAGQ